MRQVSFCFGRWGNMMCNSIMCSSYKECQDCYWSYWFKKKDDRTINLREIINEYANKHKLKLKEFQNGKMRNNNQQR